MSFQADGVKTRPERVKPTQQTPPAAAASPTDATPLPPSWSKRPQRPRGRSRSSNKSARSRSRSSSAASFHSAHFPPDEEARMVTASHHLKGQANAQFAAQDYSSAISTYDRALAELPNYLDYEAAVLQSNVAACHLKLEQWKEAADRCEKGLEALEREIPTKPKPKNNEKKGDEANKAANVNGIGRPINDSESESEEETPDEAAAIVELPDADEADTLAALESLRVSDARRADVHRIRTKLLLRRARARSAPTSAPAGGGGGGGGGSPKEAVQESTSNWSNLASALEDYKTLSTPPYFNSLPSSDQKTVRHALVSLPPRVDEAKQREVGEMMGKLKDLGNGILRPFGLSTDNFKVVPGEGGGYSLSFDGAGGK